MDFTCDGAPLPLEINTIIVAGWTGRNLDAVNHHIAELAELGVAPPSQVPLYYRVSKALLTQDRSIDVLGAATSGEVEPLLIKANGVLWLGLGSDHTDRELEAWSVAASKQACAKPVSPELWPLEAVRDHLDALVLRCHIEEGGAWVLYQEGPLAAIRPLTDLVDQSGMTEGTAMLCGTLGAQGGVRPAGRYRMELNDPVRQRSLHLNYDVTILPVVA